MESISSEIFSILKYLLPGFLTAWIFHAFTSYPKQAQFERVIQALIFTIFIQASVYIIKDALLYLGKWIDLGTWNSNVHIVWSFITAVTIGFLFSYFANSDLFHRFMRFIKVTKQTSYHCEWYGTFLNNDCFVILHLNDDRRVFGWPYDWPSDSTKGHIVLMGPSWVEGNTYIDMPTVKSIMFNVQDVKWVEFLQTEPEVKYV